jgi:hypothetical protein
MVDYIPQVDYTSRDYSSIKEDMLSLVPNFTNKWSATDPADFGVVLVELFAYMGDLLNYYIDRAANENFIQSATQSSTILKLASLYGYSPYSITPSTASVTFANVSSSSILVPTGTLLSAGVDNDGNNIYFETTSDATVPANGSVASIPVKQGSTIYTETVGTSDGSANQKFSLANVNVDLTSITVAAANRAYTQVTNTLYYNNADKVFSAKTDSDNITSITFGDGISGAIPPNGTTVLITYRICNGLTGNVVANAISTIVDTGYDSVSISSSTAASGGTDSETAESVRFNAPLFLRSGNRAVSIVDYQNLALNISGVAKARAVSQYFSQVIIFIMGDNWGQPSTTLRTSVINELTNKVPPSTSLQIVGGTLAYLQFGITVNALPSYNVSAVATAVRAKLLELFSYTNVDFSQRVTRGSVYSYINRSSVDGLDFIVIDGLTSTNTAPTAQISAAPSNTTDLYLSANEIPYLDSQNIYLVTGTGIS